MPNEPQPRPPRRVVLLAEDEPTIAIPLSDELEEHGFAVVHEADGDAALDRLRRRRFDALITDLRLPGRSGLELLADARARRLELPLLLITAYADASSERAAVAQRAQVLRKPFDNVEVIDWLRGSISPAFPADAPRPAI